MPINPNIALGVRSPRIQAFDEAGAIQDGMKLKDMMMQGQLNQMKMQEAQRTQQEDDAVRSAYQQSGGDSAKLRDLLNQGGHYKQVQALDKNQLEIDEKRSTIDKNKATTAKSRFDQSIAEAERVASMLNVAKQNPQAYPAIRQMLNNLNPEAAATLPEQFDPMQLDAIIARGQTLTQQLQEKRAQEQASETARHNRTTEGLTARGQNMTDSRARERLAFDQGGAVADAGGPAQTALTKQYGKAPPGYRWKTDGSQEPIPGGVADEKSKVKAAGAEDVGLSIATLRDAYDRLEKGGGITSTKNSAIGNIAASTASSDFGQAVGKKLGTNNQSARNDIAMARPALLAALMKATGMSAKQMDSNAELKLWLATATDATLDVEANRRALDNIERKYLGDKPSNGASGDWKDL